MPDHSPEHMARLAQASAAQRRTDKLARLIASSPQLSEAQARRLHALIKARAAGGGA